MSQHTLENRSKKKSPAHTAEPSHSDNFGQWLEEFEHGADPEGAVTRLRAHETFDVSLGSGVDNLAGRARAFFDAIPASRLAISPGSDQREVFRFALEICTNMVALAVMDGRRDLERVKLALHAGRVALAERNRGFDEPLLSVRKRSPSDARESFHSLQIKTWCAMACEVLICFGLGERVAAKRVGALIDSNRFRNRLLRPKSPIGKSDKSILNWRERWKRGDLQKLQSLQVTTGAGCFLNIKRVENSQGCVGYPVQSVGLFRDFPKASALWREGRPEAARKAVLGELADRVEEIRCSAPIETSPHP
jgi:hypothetical protein